MTNSDTQTMLARFYGQLQAQQLRAKAYAESKNSGDSTLVSPDRFRVDLTEHGVRVVDTTTGKTEFSNSIYTCALAATPIRNQLAWTVARAMKILFIAKQSITKQRLTGRRWEDFATIGDFVIPQEDGDVVRYVNILKAETTKAEDKRTKILSHASLSIGATEAWIISACLDFTIVLKPRVETLICSYFSDIEEQNAADRFVTALTERRKAAQLKTTAALKMLQQARRDNSEKKVKPPLADKFAAVTGKKYEEPLGLPKALKAHDEASRLFEALDWLAAELGLVPNTTAKEERLHQS